MAADLEQTPGILQAQGLQELEVDTDEYGRRYHAYKEGAYPFPNDENEQDRLDFVHHMLMTLFDKKSFLAPAKKENLKRILDAGTGTGIWAIQVGDEFPEAEVLGNDLSPIQPQWVPPNVKFEVDDIEEPWTNATPFDLIFARYLDGAISNWPRLVQNMYEHTRPGGWVELQGFDTRYKSDDGSLKPDSPLHHFVGTMEEGSKKLGKELYSGPRLESLLKDAGFVNVHAQMYKLPLGPWPKDKKMKEVGMLNIMQVLEGMEAFSYRLFSNVLGWKLEEVKVSIAKTVAEIKSKNLHAYDIFYVAYGQRPE